MPQPPTQQQTLHLTLDGGIDQRVYERHVPTTELLDAVNVRFNKTGGADKRPGCAAYATNFTAGDGRIIAYRDSLVATDNHTIGPASSVPGSAQFLARDKYPEAVPSSRSVSYAAATISMTDIAYSSASGGYFVYAWSDAINFIATGEVFATVQDAATGAELCSAVRLSDGTASGQNVRVITLGTTVFALWRIPTVNAIVWCKFDPTTQAWTAPANLVTDAADVSFDACTTASKIYLVYRNTTNQTVIKSFDSTPALVATAISSEADPGTGGFGISASDSDYVWYSYVFSTGGSTLAYVGAFTANLVTETLTPLRIFTAVTAVDEVFVAVPVRYSSTRAAVLISTAVAGAGFSTATAVVDVSSTLLVDPTNRRAYWTLMGSRPFVASTSPLRVMAWVYAGGARYDAPLVAEQPYQYTYTLVDLGVDDLTTPDLPPRPICWEANRFANIDGLALESPPSSCVNIGNARYAIATVLRDNGGRVGMLRVKADFASAARFASAELGQTLHLTPGWIWDGARCFELGYCYWPQKPSSPTFSNTAGGHLTAGSTYRRKVVYEWSDNLGNIHRSEPSDPLEFTVTGGNDTATYKVPCLCLTARSDAAGDFVPSVRLVIYGTQSTDIDGLTYYRLFDLNSTPVNDPLSASVTITDTGNLLLTQQPELYTLGGALPNVQPRGCTAMVTYRNRLWIAYGNTVNYSKAYVTGECVSFTDSFELPLEETGDITAMWVMDDRLFISTASRIYWLQADGPADDGTQNDVGTPNRIATDLGCIEPRSLVVTPLGTIYQSAVSLELLDRGLQVAAEPFGYKVRTELANYPTVTGAIVHPSGGYFVVSVNTAAGDAGERLVHDYTQGRWSRDSLLGGKAILSTAVLNGTVYFLTSDGNVYRELPSTDSAAYLDAGAWVTMSVKTAWIHPAGPQGYQWAHRVLWMGDKSSNHALTIQSFVDYATSADKTWSVTSAQINSFPIPQYSIDPLNQRCMAVSFVVSDGAPTGAPGTGKGSMFAALAVDVETAGNSWELPAVQKG